MRISIDRSKCIGAGNCVLSAPDLFSQDDDDGLVVVLSQDVDAEHRAGAEEAQQLCPAKVIQLDD